MRRGRAVLISVGLSLLIALPLLSSCSLSGQALPQITVRAASASELGLVLTESRFGPYVLAVLCDSPASCLGFRPGDIVIEAEDSPLSSAADLDAALTEGRGSRFTLLRSGQRIQLAREAQP